MFFLRKAIKFLAFSLAILVLFISVFWIIPNIINMRTSISTEKKVLALTFDDGPYSPWTEQILDLLLEENVKATFYLACMNLEKNMELGVRIVSEGHEVGNHLYNGEALTFKRPSKAIQIFKECDDRLKEIGAVGNITVRQGRLAGGPGVGYIVWKEKRQQILASAYSRDWLRPGWTSNICPLRFTQCPTQDSDQILADILPSLEPGAIILLHDGYDNTSGADRSGTLVATKEIIRHAKQQGYHFITVNELLNMEK